MIIEIKGDKGKMAKFMCTPRTSPTGEDELVFLIKKGEDTLAFIILPISEMLKGLKEVNQYENSGNDQG